MKIMRSILCGLFAVALAAPASGESPYVPETDPLVIGKLEQWQDWKFGFMMHWGAYSQRGIVESWSICSEDVDWCKRPDGIAYVDYVKRYEQLPDTFNPVRFDPDLWALIARDAGMRYVVFTTKHHDGFSMFDTAQSSYKITAKNVPFHTNPRADVTRAVFAAFRAHGLKTGAYFSKPDWHSDDYWWRRFATPNRQVNYDTRKYPERWQRFKDFTYRQIEELMTGYGPVDILWLDGGWVRPGTTKLKDLDGDLAGPHMPQDIDMPRIVSMARRHQPGLIVVDRAVGGPFEDYRTPEKKVPDTPLPYPWETVMTLGDSWSYAPNDNYKSAREVVRMLVDVVAKGGNLLLDVGPDGNGELPPMAVSRLHEIGLWMKVNGDAIYRTRKIAPYADGKFRFTSARDGTIYAIYLPDEKETELPKTLRIQVSPTSLQGSPQILGAKALLEWRGEGNAIVVDIPEAERQRSAGAYAWSFRLPARPRALGSVR